MDIGWPGHIGEPPEWSFNTTQLYDLIVHNCKIYNSVQSHNLHSICGIDGYTLQASLIPRPFVATQGKICGENGLGRTRLLASMLNIVTCLL